VRWFARWKLKAHKENRAVSELVMGGRLATGGRRLSLARRGSIPSIASPPRFLSNAVLFSSDNSHNLIVTYASETWVLKENMIQKLLIFERKILRGIFGPTKENQTWRIKAMKKWTN